MATFPLITDSETDVEEAVWHAGISTISVPTQPEIPVIDTAPEPTLPIWIWLRGVAQRDSPASVIYDYSTNHRTVVNATGTPVNSLTLLNPDTGGSVDMTAATSSLTTDFLPEVFYTTGTWRILATIRKANIPPLSSSDGAILLQQAQWDPALHGPTFDLDRHGLYFRVTRSNDSTSFSVNADGFVNINGNQWFVASGVRVAASYGEWIDIEIEKYNVSTTSYVSLKLDGVLVDTSLGLPLGIGGLPASGYYAPELSRPLTVNRQNIFTVPYPPTYSTHVLGELRIDIDGYTSPPVP